MKRSGKIRLGNLWVGIIIVFAMAMLLYSSFRGGGTSMFEPKDTLVAYFANVNGLVRGAPVWLGGVEVGNVKSIKFVNLDEKRRIRVVISVKESVWEFITADSKLRLGTIGLLGDKYIEIIPGSKDLPLVESGAEMSILPQSGLDAMMSKAPETGAAIDTLISGLKGITRRIAEGEGTAGQLLTDTMLYHNLMAALHETTELMGEIRSRQASILEKLDSTLEHGASITGKMDRGEGSLGRLVNDEQLYANLSSSTGRMDSILAKIDRGEGSAGALVNDAELYEEIRNLVVRINNLVADIEENPRKYFKFSVF